MSGISVIVPVKNAEATLERCLASLFGSTEPPLEVIVVDDGSTDRSREIARRFPAQVLENGAPGGVSAARNTGARAARGEVFYFTDADVVQRPGTLAAIARRLADPSIDGVVGLQTDEPAYANFCSDYKNLWLRYTYRRIGGDLSVLYSSVLAVRREAFSRADGFDAHYRSPNIEDSELGKRLSERGARLRVEPEVEILHVKEYRLGSLLRTDFLRSSGLIKMQLRDRFQRIARGNYTSIPTPFVASVVATWAVPIALAVPGGGPTAAAWTLAVLAVAVPVANAELLRYFLARRGPWFVARVLLLLPLDFVAISLGLAHGLLGYLLGRRW